MEAEDGLPSSKGYTVPSRQDVSADKLANVETFTLASHSLHSPTTHIQALHAEPEPSTVSTILKRQTRGRYREAKIGNTESKPQTPELCIQAPYPQP